MTKLCGRTSNGAASQPSLRQPIGSNSNKTRNLARIKPPISLK